MSLSLSPPTPRCTRSSLDAAASAALPATVLLLKLKSALETLGHGLVSFHTSQNNPSEKVLKHVMYPNHQINSILEINS